MYNTSNKQSAAKKSAKHFSKHSFAFRNATRAMYTQTQMYKYYSHLREKTTLTVIYPHVETTRTP